MAESTDVPDAKSNENGRPRAPFTSRSSSSLSPKPWFAVPAPLKRLFSRFPLRTLPASELPVRTAPHRDQHTLYSFTTASAARHNGASFNPTCLKWQTYLKFLGVEFQTVPSTNHASPTGALPFLIPALGNTLGSETANQAPVVSSNRLQKWARENGLGREEPESMRYMAYMALLDHRIRRAWVGGFLSASATLAYFVRLIQTDLLKLYNLYLTPTNFSHCAIPMYIHPATCSLPVRLALSRTLQAAALAELLTTSPFVSPDALYADADTAFSALSTLLGDEEWFFSAMEPGLFDASVFAYTFLLLGGIDWQDRTLREKLSGYQNLVAHKERIQRMHFSSRTS